MSFIGPRLFIQIDYRLCEAFPENKSTPFGGRSIILVGDLGQLPPIRDKPMYVGKTTSKVLWEKFNIVVTLDTIFRQQCDDPKQSSFRNLFANIRNACPLIVDWDLLMSRCDNNLSPEERSLFDSTSHLFPTNNSVSLHNRCMLESLNAPIARCVVEHTRKTFFDDVDDDQL